MVRNVEPIMNGTTNLMFTSKQLTICRITQIPGFCESVEGRQLLCTGNDYSVMNMVNAFIKVNGVNIP